MKKLIQLLTLCAALSTANATNECGSHVQVTLEGVVYSNPLYPFDGLNGTFTARRYGDYDHAGYCRYDYLTHPNQYGVYMFISVHVYDGEYYVQQTLIRQGMSFQVQAFISEGEDLPLQNLITENGGTALVQ